jgi:hypothetical protein
MIIKDFLKEIETMYNKQFPTSKIFVKFNTNLYSSIIISCMLAGNNTENAGNYWENDMFNIRFSIDNEGRAFQKDITIDSELPENLQIESSMYSYLIKPENKYHAYSSHKLTFRKTKGNVEKILNTLDKFFVKLKCELLQDIEKELIHNNHLNLLLEKLK